MNYQNILSENFKNLTETALKEKQNYLSARPFPNIVLKNFFNIFVKISQKIEISLKNCLADQIFHLTKIHDR